MLKVEIQDILSEDQVKVQNLTVSGSKKWPRLLVRVFLCLLIAHSLKSQTNLPQRQRDQRWTTLAKSIQETRLSSPQHEIYLLQSKNELFDKETYSIYHHLTKLRSANGYAMLWRGMAAFFFWQSRHLKQSADVEAQLLEARDAFARCKVLIPNEPILLREYGFFLWQYDNQMSEGLKMMLKAISLHPKDSILHLLLGNVYSNRSGNAYSTVNSEKEYRLAVHLNPYNKEGHWGLAMLYFDQENYRAAQEQVTLYIRLCAGVSRQSEIRQQTINAIMNQKF